MRSLTKVLILILSLTFLCMGCDRRPIQEINDTEAAVNAAIKESANKYAREEIKKLKVDFDAALNEIEMQSKKVFRDYGKARELLSKVKTDAEALKNVTIPSQREEAKKKPRTSNKKGRI